MTTISRLQRSLRVAAAAAAVLAGAVAASASGAAPAPRTAAVSLCGQSGRVTTVVVTRGAPLNPERFTFPRRSVSSDTMAVRALARALCALPPMPKGPLPCPSDFSPTYRLDFTVGVHVTTGAGAPASIRPVSVESTGCRGVTGLGAVRRVVNNSFFRVLGAAIGLPHATAATFVGVMTQG